MPALTLLSLQMDNPLVGKNQKRSLLDALIHRSWERWWNCSRKAGGWSWWLGAEQDGVSAAVLGEVKVPGALGTRTRYCG